MVDEDKPVAVSRVSIGVDIFDALLGGGLENDSVTTIFGPAGSGKTNLALHSVIARVKNGEKAIYFDTEGGFSVERLNQIAGEHSDAVLKNTFFLRPATFEEQVKSMERLKELSCSKNIGIIVVDTISMLYRLERKIGDDNGGDFNREFGMQVVQLNEIAHRKHIPVLIINQVYTSFDDKQVHMLGGDMLQYGSKCLIELQSLSGSKRVAILRKHRSMPVDERAYFEIVKEGIIGVKKGLKLF